MKNIVIILLLIICFILGVNASNMSYSYNGMLESEKDKFENTITNPSNEYTPKTLVPKENIVNKVANKCEDAMDSIFNKLMDIVKGF